MGSLAVATTYCISGSFTLWGLVVLSWLNSLPPLWSRSTPISGLQLTCANQVYFGDKRGKRRAREVSWRTWTTDSFPGASAVHKVRRWRSDRASFVDTAHLKLLLSIVGIKKSMNHWIGDVEAAANYESKLCGKVMVICSHMPYFIFNHLECDRLNLCPVYLFHIKVWCHYVHGAMKKVPSRFSFKL